MSSKRNSSHKDQIERWAEFVKNNPDKWKKIHTAFINAQFKKSEEFYKRLAKTKEGREKIRKLVEMKNINLVSLSE